MIAFSMCIVSYSSNICPDESHCWEVIKNVPPSCTISGYIRYKCSVCNTEMTEYLASLKHDYEYWYGYVEPTCTNPGSTTERCTRCAFVRSFALEPLGHLLDVDSVYNYVKPTCTTDGMQSYTCSRCKEEIVDEVIPATNHTYNMITVSELTCVDNGIYIYECINCGEMYVEEYEAFGHYSRNYVVEQEISPSCLKAGNYDKVYYCMFCDEELNRENVMVDALGHKSRDQVIENKINPTCTDDGSYDEVVYCERCNEELSRTPKILKKHGHTPSDITIENPVESTCTNKGSYDAVTYCTTCEVELSRNLVTTNELGHNVVIDRAIAVTCTTDGLTQGSHCSRCNEILTAQVVIPALKHNYVITDNQNVTCTNDGYNTYTCQNCNDTYTETIEKTGHSNYLYRTTASCEKAGYDVYKCSVCSALISVKVDALGHICSSFNGIVDNELSYTCSRCSKDYTMTASEVIEKWNQSVINASAKDFPELDVTNDGIINAKDYAKLKHIQSFGN